MKGNVVPLRRKGSPLNMDALDAAFKADLAKSGITPGVARKLGYRLVTPDEAWDLIYPKRAGDRDKDFTAYGYWIPYFKSDGKQSTYGRVRKLGGNFLGDDGEDRYRGPVNTLPHLYVPLPLLNAEFDPKTDKLNITGRVIITEGEKKTALPGTAGVTALALGGVNMKGSAKHAIYLAEEFDWFDWPNIDVSIIFDSDAYTKKTVNQALYTMGYSLRREKKPKSIRYPRLTSEHDSRTALDDYLAQFGTPDQVRRAIEQIPAKKDLTAEAFARFNEVVQVRKLRGYYNTNTDTFYTNQNQIVQEYGVGMTVPSEDGKKRVLPINLWLTERDEQLTTVMNVVYSPGKPDRYRAAQSDEHDTLNQWRPGPLEPTPIKKDSDVAPFLEFLAYVTPSLTDDERNWLLDWMAYPIQHPGAKLMQAVLLWSESNGSGKNTLAYILRDIYGANNTSVIDGSSLGDQFNTWMLKQYAVVNEVHLPTFAERLAVMERLKTAITEDTIDLRRMFMPRENVPNHMNMFLTSNRADALMLDEHDRRFFVIQGPKKADKWSPEQFKQFHAWLKEKGGNERVYGYLLARDLKGFNPYGAAPHTTARRAMLRGGDNQLNDLLDVLETRPLVIIGQDDPPVAPDCELYTPDRILAVLRGYANRHNIRLPHNLTVKSLGASLGPRNFVKKKFEIKTHTGKRANTTVYALWNGEAWAEKPKAKWRAHMKDHGNQEFDIEGSKP